MTAWWSAGENSLTVCDTDFSLLPASSSPTAPPGFSGAASGQRWSSPGGSGAPPGPDTHTAVSAFVFSSSAPPVGPKVLNDSTPACSLTAPRHSEPPQPILPTTVSSAAPTTDPGVDHIPTVAPAKSALAPMPAKSAPAPGKSPPATARSAPAPVRSAPAPRSRAESSPALPEEENLALECPKEPESGKTADSGAVGSGIAFSQAVDHSRPKASAPRSADSCTASTGVHLSSPSPESPASW